MYQPSALITTEIIGRLGPELLRHATRFMSRADAEDVVQETWLAALRAGSSLRDAKALKGWLRTILRRRMIYDRRRTRHFSSLDHEVASPCSDEAYGPRDLSRVMSRVHDGLAQLAPLERRAVYLVDVCELDRDAATIELSVTRGHLRVLLCKGRAKLGKHLEKHGLSARAGSL